MGRFMWDNMNVKPLKLEEITVDKLIEIEKHAEEVRLEQLTLKQLNKLSKERDRLLKELSRVEMDCQLRAMRAHTLGFSKKELAEIFNVKTNQITKWVG